MNFHKMVYKILISVILAIFLLSSLTDVLDQDSVAFTSTVQLSSFTPDGDYSFDKKKNFTVLLKGFFLCILNQAQEHVRIFKPSFSSLPTAFPYFLRAPPLN